jgi:hypothetical protein
MRLSKDKKVSKPYRKNKSWIDLYNRAEVGDSFLVPDHHKRQNAFQAARAMNIQIVSRTVKNGIRIWIVSKDRAKYLATHSERLMWQGDE